MTGRVHGERSWVLALHTSSGRAAAAVVSLLDEGPLRPVARATSPEPRRPAMSSGAIVPLVESVLAEAGVSVADLARVAVATGPGSFTGIKVGLSFAWGLAHAMGAQLTGLGSLQVLAYAAWLAREHAPGQESLEDASGRTRVRAAIAGVRASAYTACYDFDGSGAGTAVEDPCLVDEGVALERAAEADLFCLDTSAVRRAPDQRRRWLARARERDLFVGEPEPASWAGALARLARRVEAGAVGSGAMPEPVYLRRSWAEEAAGGGA